MSCEPLNMSREKKRQFRQGKFPEDIITKDMIREMSFTVECPAGSPNYKEFKLTEGMLFTNVPAALSPPIEYCDHLLEINNIKITSKIQMYSILRKIHRSNKSNFVDFKVRRVISCERVTDDRSIPSNAAIRKPYSSNVLVKPNSGYAYYKIVLIYFPRSKLGINIKSYRNVVYVESTDNTWGSTTRRFLYVGDVILKIDGTEIFDLKATQNALKVGLQTNGLVTMIVERAVDQASNNFIRSVLNWSKIQDPHLAADVMQTCKQRLEYLKKNGHGPEPTSIWKGKYPNAKTRDYSKAPRVNMTDKVKINRIHGGQFNPAMLQACPDYQTIPECPKKNQD